jgi:hypothetical protein
MEEITFTSWRLAASVVDTDALKLDVEALDGTDIIEVGYAGRGSGRIGETYALHFTTEQIEEMHNRPVHAGQQREPAYGAGETDMVDRDLGRSDWLVDEADEDETLYVHGWEVTAFVDEEGMLDVNVQKGEDYEIFELEPIESGMPLSSRLIIRLAAQEVLDEDEGEDEDDELDDDGDDFDLDDLDELDEPDLNDDYDDGFDTEDDDAEGLSPYDDLYDRGQQEDWY